jgi:hypothetical protein
MRNGLLGGAGEEKRRDVEAQKGRRSNGVVE